MFGDRHDLGPAAPDPSRAASAFLLRGVPAGLLAVLSWLALERGSQRPTAASRPLSSSSSAAWREGTTRKSSSPLDEISRTSSSGGAGFEELASPAEGFTSRGDAQIGVRRGG